MKKISGGVCAPNGFKATGIHSGITKNPNKNDLALIFSDIPATTAFVTTQNKIKAAPIKVTVEHGADHVAQAIICNSGNANACTPNGMEVAYEISQLVATQLKIEEHNVLVASTGVIGQPLDITPIKKNISQLVDSLTVYGSDRCASAIMTTDLSKKEIAVEILISETAIKIGGISKGSGMIHPNMATMLGFITTDVAITPELLQDALSEITNLTFNMISVDGDTSTNDMVVVMANGLAKNPIISDKNSSEYKIFYHALLEVCQYLAKSIAADGEGASKMLECTVSGAENLKDAQQLAKSVIQSNLFKAAMFGKDANWGRVLCALGYSDAILNPDTITIAFSSIAGTVTVCSNSVYTPFSEELALQILQEPEIQILVSIGNGSYSATAWGCDLTHEYVTINGDYRS